METEQSSIISPPPAPRIPALLYTHEPGRLFPQLCKRILSKPLLRRPFVPPATVGRVFDTVAPNLLLPAALARDRRHKSAAANRISTVVSTGDQHGLFLPNYRRQLPPVRNIPPLLGHRRESPDFLNEIPNRLQRRRRNTLPTAAWAGVPIPPPTSTTLLSLGNRSNP